MQRGRGCNRLGWSVLHQAEEFGEAEDHGDRRGDACQMGLSCAREGLCGLIGRRQQGTGSRFKRAMSSAGLRTSWLNSSCQLYVPSWDGSGYHVRLFN